MNKKSAPRIKSNLLNFSEIIKLMHVDTILVCIKSDLTVFCLFVQPKVISTFLLAKGLKKKGKPCMNTYGYTPRYSKTRIH